MAINNAKFPHPTPIFHLAAYRIHFWIGFLSANNSFTTCHLAAQTGSQCGTQEDCVM